MRVATISHARPMAARDKSALTFGFRLKFHLPPGRTFKGVHPRRRLRLVGIDGRVYLVKLRQPKRHRFGARTKHLLLGERFATHQAAQECGKRLKFALALFAAEQRLGVDVGKDQGSPSVSQAIKKSLAAKQGIQLRDDIHGLDVYAEQPEVRRLSVEAYGSVKYVVENYEAPIKAFYGTQVELGPKQELALDLYNLSHFENIPKTRFLTLVSVVEILAARKKRSPATRALLKDLIKSVRSSTLTLEDQQKLADGLGNLHQESINSACKDFVAQHAPMGDALFFAECYKARSELVHDGVTKRSEATDTTRLDELVSRLLITSLTAAVAGTKPASA